MKAQGIVMTLTALALAIVLAACGKPSTYTQETLDEASGVKVTAENASSDSEATTEGAITVEEGDIIVISPCMEAGSFHLTITAEDGGKVVYDDDASGRILFTIKAAPGVYDVTTHGNDATGWMTVFAQSSEEFSEQDESLAQELKKDDVGDSAREEPTDIEG